MSTLKEKEKCFNWIYERMIFKHKENKYYDYQGAEGNERVTVIPAQAVNKGRNAKKQGKSNQ